MSTVIQATGVGKSYQLRHEQQEKYASLRDVMTERARSLGSRVLHPFRPSAKVTREEFWALRDVSFDIGQGERVGIIGRNGAGKSTLLKILSRITEPATGRVVIDGRVASLLEVGTGFHPELTGRENIFLNGSILGMSREEIVRKFDEIVEFADVERFLDTPVKRYSSGMYVRLAFAVAAHLEPEILVVDEVLAVGDAQFQKKCLGKMQSVGRDGRTVLFVSHNMAAIEGLCDRVIVLQGGTKVFDGNVQDGIRRYFETIQTDAAPIAERTDRKGSGKVRVVDIRVQDGEGNETASIPMGGDLSVTLRLRGELRNAIVGVMIGNMYKTQILRGYTYESHGQDFDIRDGMEVTCRFRNLPLMHGRYQIHTWVGQIREVADFVEGASDLEIVSADVFGTGKQLDATGGDVFCPHSWEFSHDVRA